MSLLRGSGNVRATRVGEMPEQMLFEYQTKTDSNGNFEFSKVPGGRAVVFVTPENIKPLISGMREVQVKSGESVSVSLSVGINQARKESSP
jgi:hypothetical protein